MDENLLEISDGKLYGLNDMARIGCHDCAGCSACCEGMGDSILLDPHDIFMLTGHLGKTFDQLLEQEISLHMEEGLILPNLKMRQETDRCVFLGEDGRCTIHDFRPGICRLFPMGRNYDGDALQYFVLKDACPVTNKTKMKIDRWVAAGSPKKYHRFLIDWHRITKQFREELKTYEEKQAGQLTYVFLNLFYRNAYTAEDFYSEFYERCQKLGLS